MVESLVLLQVLAQLLPNLVANPMQLLLEGLLVPHYLRIKQALPMEVATANHFIDDLVQV